jgi:hypothetical protein
MKDEEKIPTWVLWVIKHGGIVLLGGAVLIMLIIITAVYYLENRLAHLETNITYQPPRNFEPVDLEKYAAKNVTMDSMTVSETVYVPVYSHIYYDHGRPYPLETTLSIRNTDLKDPIFIRSVEYFDTQGKRVKKNVDRLIRLGPLGTLEFLVETRDSSGGSGANFIVEWSSQIQTERPIIETVMVGTVGASGICFSRSGRALASSPDK